MSRDFKVAVGVVLLFAPAVVLYDRFLRPTSSGAERQRANMDVAQEELPKVRTALAADPGFKDVTAFVYTGQDGAVGLAGTVEKDDDLFRLMKAIAAERLRVAVSWQVNVRGRE